MFKKKLFSLDFLLVIVIIGLVILTLFNTLKNISYPLFWQDEAETVVYAENVLKTGLPKINNGKNILNESEIPDETVKAISVYNVNPHTWAQFYFPAPFIYLSQYFADFYTKNLIIRTPQALIGLLGVAIFLLIPLKLLPTKRKKYLFSIIFLVFENFSIFLILHLREVRYYSFLLFFLSLFFFIFINYRFLGKGKKVYFYVLPLVLFFLFNSFFPAYIITFIYFGLFEAFLFFKDINKLSLRNNFLNHLKELIPLFASVLLILPQTIILEIYKISGTVTEVFGYNFLAYFNNLFFTFSYFAKYEYLCLAILVKIILFFVLKKHQKLSVFLKENKLAQISTFFSFFFLFYPMVIANNPYTFERYFLPLQPILILVILIDLFLMFDIFRERKIKTEMLPYFFIFVAMLLSVNKIDLIKGHLYELTHVFKGPLDYIIPYIKQNYKNPENLIIATNYEEPSYMFYLKSKVIIGFQGKNLQADMKLIPDIIIPRRDRPNSSKELKALFNKAEYQKVAFPVYDYQYNNIADIALPLPHLFKTLTVDKADLMTNIYIKK
jgi:hypothetical protein